MLWDVGCGLRAVRWTRLRSCTSGPGPGIAASASAPAPQTAVARAQETGGEGSGGAGGSDWETGTPPLCGCVPRHQGRQRKNEQKADLRKQKPGVLQRENQNEKPAEYINEFPNCCQIPDPTHSN